MTDFNVPIPQDELDAKPSFLLDAGWYASVLQPGVEVVDSKTNPDWKGIRVPFSGFTSKKDGKVYEKDRSFQITVAGSDEAVKIGRKQLTQVAAAFGLTEQTTVDGKAAQRMTATSPEELASQLNALAGTPCDVYVTVKKRKRGGEVVMKDDGSGPVMDNEISAVAALGAGK